MIIHPHTQRRENGSVTLAARIELEQPPYDVPNRLWFQFPDSQAELLSDRADAFAVSLLYYASQRGERLCVRGALSPRLAYGMQEYLRILCIASPHLFKPIEINADAFSPAEYPRGKNASAFSGGADSFFTLWSHLARNESYPGNELSFAVFVQGFDIDLRDDKTFEVCRTAYDNLLRGWGIRLLTARTNARAFDPTGNWATSVNVALAGVAHALGRGLARFYVSPDASYSAFPYGTIETLVNELLSSESLGFLSDGSRFTKFDKLATLARVPEAYTLLRVCYAVPNGLLNCCKCGKCQLVMAALEACNSLQFFRTFPLPFEPLRLITAPMPYGYRYTRFAVMRGARRHKRYDIVFYVALQLILNYLRWSVRWLARRILPHRTRPLVQSASEIHLP